MEKSHSKYGIPDSNEELDFPIACETCMGPNPYVRMQKFFEGGVCHISGRTYTSFRWKAGNDARYKKTVICQKIAKLKNVCQVCMLDLDFNLPVQVRDKSINMYEESLPMTPVQKEYMLNQAEINENKYNHFPVTDLLLKLARTEPYFKRNLSRLCSFFVKGCCNRGAECPYRHAYPSTSELSKQSYHCRYYGIHDPVADRMLARAEKMPCLKPPSDTNITTLFIGNLTPMISVQDIREVFSLYGELDSVKIFHIQGTGFVKYRSRQAAEQAVNHLHTRLLIKGSALTLRWGKLRKKDNCIEEPPQKSYKITEPNCLTYVQRKESHTYGAMNPNQFGSAPISI